jgi:amidase
MAAGTRRDILLGAAATALAGTGAAPGAVAGLQAAPFPASDWDYSSASTLVSALRAKKVSALELADRAIARIEALDARINAVVVRDFERAREAARAADVSIAREEGGALVGVPVTIKESFDVAGLPTTWGDPRFRRFMPKEDALTVNRLRAAGAIILGKTNVPLWLGDWQSYNAIHGVTSNPWNAARTPGGSSGGSAAALASGFGAVSLGSDLGGSMRIPAHFCGVYAHRPTFGLVPRRGHQPPGAARLPDELDLATIGPMARTAADLELALDVLSGPDPQESGAAWRLGLPPARHDRLAEFRVLVLDAHPLVPTAVSVRNAIADLRDRLARTGARVATASPLLPDLIVSARVFVRLAAASLSARLPRPAFERDLRKADALSSRDKSLDAEWLRGAALGHREWLASDNERAKLKQTWRELFREWDIVLCPAAPVAAFPHDRALPMEARRLKIDGGLWPYADVLIVWPSLAAVAGLPATVAPLGRQDAGLPIGVQIIGPAFEDRTPLAFAALMERAFGGFTPPPG